MMSHEPVSPDVLQTLRRDIDAVDDEIIAAIVRRIGLARAIGALKQRTGQPVLDPAREASVVSRAAARGRAAGLREQDVRTLYWQIMALARRAQTGSGAAGDRTTCSSASEASAPWTADGPRTSPREATAE